MKKYTLEGFELRSHFKKLSTVKPIVWWTLYVVAIFVVIGLYSGLFTFLMK